MIYPITPIGKPRMTRGRRVFNKRGMAKAIGLKSEGGNAFLKIIGRKGLGSEIDEKLHKKIENPIYFNYLRSDPVHAYDQIDFL
jgi:hypothetical protein